MAVLYAEQTRLYVAGHGGYATVAAAIGVTPEALVEYCAGRTPVTTQIASGMAPLLSVPVTLMLAEDADYQLLNRRGAAP